MILTLTTQSGSHYELDPGNQRIRRLSGTHEPTLRQGPDGEWRTYLTTSSPTLHQSLTVVWRLRDDDTAECLFTSPLTAITRAASLEELLTQ